MSYHFPRWVRSVALAVGFLAAGCSAPRVPAQQVVRATPACSPFEWAAHPVLGPYAAMRMQVVVGGKPHWFQVDTGVDTTALHGRGIVDELGASVEQVGLLPMVKLDITVLGEERKQQPLWVMDHHDENDGSVGFDVFVGRVTFVDFGGRRICSFPAGDAPRALMDKTHFTGARISRNKFFPTFQVNGANVTTLFYDTGASAIPMLLNQSTWQRWTGSEPITRTVSVGTWGRDVPFVGAPPTSQISVAGRALRVTEIFFSAQQPEMFSGWKHPADGLVGNAAFLDSVVVLDASAQPRFGLLAPAAFAQSFP